MNWIDRKEKELMEESARIVEKAFREQPWWSSSVGPFPRRLGTIRKLLDMIFYLKYEPEWSENLKRLYQLDGMGL